MVAINRSDTFPMFTACRPIDRIGPIIWFLCLMQNRWRFLSSVFQRPRWNVHIKHSLGNSPAALAAVAGMKKNQAWSIMWNRWLCAMCAGTEPEPTIDVCIIYSASSCHEIIPKQSHCRLSHIIHSYVNVTPGYILQWHLECCLNVDQNHWFRFTLLPTGWWTTFEPHFHQNVRANSYPTEQRTPVDPNITFPFARNPHESHEFICEFLIEKEKQ